MSSYFEINTAFRRVKLYREIGEEILSLEYGRYNNFMRIYVKQHPKDDIRAGSNIMNAVVTAQNFELLINELRELSSKPENYSFTIDLLGMLWENDKPVPNATKYHGSLKIMRTKDSSGTLINVLIAVTENKKEYAFPFLPTPFTKIYRYDKELIDKKELSILWTNAYVNNLNRLLSIFPEAYKELPATLLNKKF